MERYIEGIPEVENVGSSYHPSTGRKKGRTGIIKTQTRKAPTGLRLSRLSRGPAGLALGVCGGVMRLVLHTAERANWIRLCSWNECHCQGVGEAARSCRSSSRPQPHGFPLLACWQSLMSSSCQSRDGVCGLPASAPESWVEMAGSGALRN